MILGMAKAVSVIPPSHLDTSVQSEARAERDEGLIYNTLGRLFSINKRGLGLQVRF